MRTIFAFVLLLCAAQTVFAQNVGIGTFTPDIRLDVLSTAAHTARFAGPNAMYISFYENNVYRGYIGSFAGADEDVDFGTGASNATGKLHLTTQGLPRLSIMPGGNVGIGTQTPSRKLDIAGSLGFNGALFVNGQSGSEGQVLMSNGAGTPSWQNVAYGNTTRFGIRYQKVGSTNTLDVANTYYNLNPADVTINASSIVINKSGLYRFQGYVTGLVQGEFTRIPEMTCDMNFSGGNGYQYDLMQWKVMPLRTAVNINYYQVEQYSIDMYITAPTTISFSMSFLSTPDPTYEERNIRLFGYLLSE